MPKLEGRWSYDEAVYPSVELAMTPSHIPRGAWCYQLLLRMPDFVTEKDVEQALKVALMKRKICDSQHIKLILLPSYKAIQVLHVGPFEREHETLQAIESVISEKKLKRNGRHHEIYLSDFRKTTADKLKIILREPVV